MAEKLVKSYRYQKTLIALLIIGVILSVFGNDRIFVDTFLLNYIRESLWVKKSTDYIEQYLGGISPLEITVDTKEDGDIKEPEVLRQIDDLQTYLNSLSEVDKTVSPVQFIKEMHQAFNEEDEAFYFVDLTSFMDVEIGEQLHAPIYFWGGDGMHYPLT